jgi:hypothetical protein
MNMPCDTRLKPGQKISERIKEVRDVQAKVEARLANGKVRARVGPTGGITFQGLSDEDRDNVTDACIYRRIMATGSYAAKAAVAKAEQLAGRSVSREALTSGHHSHDGGHTWHHGH